MPHSISAEASFQFFHHRRPAGGDFSTLYQVKREVSVLCSASLPVLLPPVLLLMAPETSTSRTGSEGSTVKHRDFPAPVGRDTKNVSPRIHEYRLRVAGRR